MKCAAAALTATLALAGTAEAKVPTLTFKQARVVLSGLAEAENAGLWTVRNCRRHTARQIDCTLDEFGVPTLVTDAPMDVLDQPVRVSRRGVWGVVTSRDVGWEIDYRQRLR